MHTNPCALHTICDELYFAKCINQFGGVLLHTPPCALHTICDEFFMSLRL